VSVARPLKRRDLFPDPLIDGQQAPNNAFGRLRRRMDSLLVTGAERQEADIERRLRAHRGVTRPNVVAMLSPKGGVGKTTSTFLVGNLLASHPKLRTIAVDADPGLGTLGRLPADSLQADQSLVDLLRDLDRVGTAAELRPYVSRLPSGLHLLAGPGDGVPPPIAEHGCLGTLVAFLSCFYETIVLDLGTGVANPLARLAIERADQVTVVTTPDSVAVHLALHALGQLEPERTTLVVNRAHPRREPVVDAIEEYARGNVARLVTMPDDSRLALMLASGTYSLEALDGRMRLAVKRLGLAVAERLV
jgi:putative peptide zinc metalloprotease protein